MLRDSNQRAQATDPARSFIVQAPAGSGKTEILTQRYLRLLGLVKVPEQIVALTFTRKAASEMRERIILALQKVAAGEKASSPHQQQTFNYAAKALARSAEFNWQLLEQSSRLRIITIDSLCQLLSHAIPLQEQQIPYAQISDDPSIHYENAARACFSHALEEPRLQSALKCLLTHLDNRQDNLLDLLSALLAKREQWLTSLYIAREQEKSTYEEMLAFIVEHELSRFKETIHFELREKLCALTSKMAGIENNPHSPRFLLANWQSFTEMTSEIAVSLAALLLTSEDKLRKGFDHHIGLKRGACEDHLYDQIKKDSKELLTELDSLPEFLDALIKLKKLPAPEYDADQWQVLQALFQLLPFLVGHLQLQFSEQNEVDFTAISQQALNALGTEDEPTDLTLYLDSSIQHLLVDEFQDTSIQQFQLITRLVQGWLPDDGRTLFVVGDPMQSIYRFRQAEVGLFIKAKQNGIGPVALTSLDLCSNFRSTATIVDWVNHQFRTIFPHKDDIETGAISFSASDNVQADSEDSFVEAWQFNNRLQEAENLVKIAVKVLEKYPEDDIAILVRSRTQLTELMAVLREQHISFQGVDIELLAKLPHLRDLWSLTQALFLPANRLVWLCLLRSPFCGLALADLHSIANFDKRKSIFFALANLDQINLSEDGYIRCQFIYSTLKDALETRHQLSTVDWIAQTLKNLHGDLILNEAELADLEQFWLALERFKGSELPDLNKFKKELNKLYSKRVSHSRLQVMTIHKSKGLEFDCVILPSLSASPKIKDQPLLRWLKLPRQEAKDLLLVSPIKAAHRQECRVYNYLAKLDAEKDDYELQRLFYVAATRAKKRLYLFDSQIKETRKSFRCFLPNQEFMSLEENLVEQNAIQNLPSLFRLPNDFYHRLPENNRSDPKQFLSLPQESNARHIGIVSHELLQWICDNHPATIDNLPWSMMLNRFKSLGFSEKEQTEAFSLLKNQIGNLFKDPVGQWLCKAHEEERNEYELIINNQGQASTRIIDRTFITDGQRWIIDFKTGSDGEESLNDHRQQVNHYAELLKMKVSEPIRCGLYYLASGNWVQWAHQADFVTETLANQD
ncbi:MAG: UvrD-helicase domain-containing protein [Tatlockia sp.]|nr:UvrD-helicase domain-containing protein [Tatlockia sp.]